MTRVDDSILIVDDEASNIDLLEYMLSEQGFHVRTAQSGQQALDAAAAEPPDLVLLDIKMPGLNGHEVCKCLKAKKATAKIPVLFVSGAKEREDKIKSFAVGGVDYITKPFHREEVLARVKCHLALNRMKKQLEQANQILETEVEKRTAALSQTNETLRLEIVRRIKTETELKQERDKMRSLSAELSLVEERERQKISTTLHDSAAQDLACIMLQLKTAINLTPSEETAHLLEGVHAQTEKTANQLRSLSHDLSPPALKEISLEAALEMLANNALNNRGYSCTFLDDGRPKPLAKDQRGLLYRCVQELLANSAKHAGAQSGSIRVGRRKNSIEIEVADNGKGFDVATTQNGFGLFSIQERLHGMNGAVRIESMSNQGTRVTLTVPLQLEGASAKEDHSCQRE